MPTQANMDDIVCIPCRPSFLLHSRSNLVRTGVSNSRNDVRSSEVVDLGRNIWISPFWVSGDRQANSSGHDFYLGFGTFSLRDKVFGRNVVSRYVRCKLETLSFPKHQTSSKTVHGVWRTTPSKMAMWVWNLPNQQNAVYWPMYSTLVNILHFAGSVSHCLI